MQLLIKNWLKMYLSPNSIRRPVTISPSKTSWVRETYKLEEKSRYTYILQSKGMSADEKFSSFFFLAALFLGSQCVLFLFLCLFVLREREREHASRKGAEREGERRSQAGSVLTAQS